MRKRQLRFTLWIIVLLLTAGAGSALATPKIEHWQTSNGARVYYVAAPELPMVDIHIIFDAAAAREKIPGVAMMTNDLLEEGAGKLDADQIADAFAAVGAHYGSGSYRDMSLVNLRSLTKPELLDKAVATLTSVITQPTFPEDAFERERKQMLISLQAKKQSPGAIAGDAYFEALYGDHPYGHDADGTEESVKSIKRQDLIEHHKRYYVGRNAVIAIVGAVDKQQAKQLAETILGKLPAGKAAPALPAVASLKQAEVIKKEYPSTQTHILVGQPAIKRGDKDYFALMVGNHILGGSGLVSRLSDEIREKRGLSYSTYSYFSPMHQRGPFTLGLQTRNDKADEALKLLRQTLTEFMDKGPTEKELEAAKKNITGGFALNLDSNSKIVENIAMMGFYHLPLDYLDTYTQKVDAVTTDQIKAAFKRHVQPDRMVTVMVGEQGEAKQP
jgi:zinc protease